MINPVFSVIDRLMAIGRPNTGMTLTITEAEVVDLILAAKDMFMKQPVCLELKAPVYVCGDIHDKKIFLRK